MNAGSRLRVIAATAFALLASAAPAVAQTSSLDVSYPEGFSLNRFEPAPAGDRFFSVPDATSSDVPESFRALLLTHLTLAPSVVRTDSDTGETREIVSSQFYLHVDGTYVIMPWLLANLDMPFALVQSGDGPAAPDSPALGDLRLSLRARVFGAERAEFSFAPAFDVWLPTGSEADLTGDGTIRTGLRLVASGRFVDLLYAVNVGGVFRKYVDAGSTEIGSSLGYGAALGVALFDDVVTISAELMGQGLLASHKGQNFASETSPLEALFGVRGHFRDFEAGLGVGPGLSDAPGVAPRFVASVAYAPRTAPPLAASEPLRDSDRAASAAALPEDTDSDDIADAADQCPTEKGPASSVPGENGCPQRDGDGDGIADAADACPDKPGIRSGDASHDGCPEGPLDSDEDGIEDEKDACPLEAASLAENAPKNGCPGDGPAQAIFAGYRQGARGVATVFVDLSDSVHVDVKREGRSVTYSLRGTTVGLKNNENPLLAMDFASNVERARLVSENGLTTLVIDFRSEVEPRHRMVRKARGASLEVDVPPGVATR